MCSWRLLYPWDMVMGIWGFFLERMLVVWHLLYELDLQKYNTGMLVLFFGTSCWFKCWDIDSISWCMVEGFWLWRDSKVVCEVWGCILVRVWCLVHVRVITLVHDSINMYGTWIERYICTWLRRMYDDVCIGDNYNLDTIIGSSLIWQMKQSSEF
jgi:hypothetical protein